MTTREKIVELGRDLVQQHGYHSFKYQLIATELQIKNAAIHHYFPAKEDLGVAIIEKDLEDFQTTMQALKNSSAKAKADAIIGFYISYKKAGKNLCVIGACASAAIELPEKMQTAAQHYLDTVHSSLTRTFREGLAAGEFHFDSKPEEISALWISTLAGSLQISRLGGDSYFKRALEQLKNSLKG